MAKKTSEPKFINREKPETTAAFERQKSVKLEKLKRDLFDDSKKLLFIAGLPSTGKTLSCLEASMELLSTGRYRKLIIAREVIVPKFGMIPGDSKEKMQFHTRQAEEYIEACQQFSFGQMLYGKQIEIIPVDQLQGMRFRNAIVFIDEAQQISKNDTFAILTRRGEDSKFVICGDVSKGQQSKKLKDNNILKYCIDKFKGKPYVGIHTFYDKDKDLLGDDVTKDIIVTLMDDFV
jgi:predicted ribonuclease YlaK